ncbi:hypothetical protein ADEAN_000749700 [Angomonas deanei]|uniref:Uncharacterized protein n=1 Tax=Angomonas deanei TaxID=59799 RepID=A0A7G2CN36_9TRYP|nr:hypothetical protein ADEAN_000749700 [Angomonas deanei]
MKHSVIFLTYMVVFVLSHCTAQNIIVPYNSEFVLSNALNDFDGNFSDAVTAFVSDLTPFTDALSVTGSPTSVRAYQNGNDIVLVTQANAYGTSSAVSTGLAGIESQMKSVVSSGSDYTTLNPVVRSHFNRQPDTVTSSTCTETAAINASSVTTCLRNISLSVLTNVSNAAPLKDSLCKALGVDCSLVELTGETTVAITNSNLGIAALLKKDFLIHVEDRDEAVVKLLFYAQRGSVLSGNWIFYLYINNVQVYYMGDPLSAEVGTMSTCITNLWYLIFLIILIPIFLIATQRFYYCGKRSGRKSVKKNEAEIRSGVHLSPGANPWLNQQWGQQQWGQQQWGQAPQQQQQQWGQGPQQQQQWGQAPQQQQWGQSAQQQQWGQAPQQQQQWGQAPQQQQWGQEPQQQQWSQPQKWDYSQQQW